jgi:hypothetical protein
VSVKIVPHSGADLISDSLKLFYRSKSQYQSAPLYSTAVPDSFYGYIPAQKAGTNVFYYIQAADNSGRVETHPYIGAPWAHKFNVNGPPVITSDDSIVCPTSSDFAYCPEYTDPDDTAISITYSDYPAWLSVQNDSLLGITPDESTTANFVVSISDPYYTTDQTVNIKIYSCGDANDDGDINVADAVYIIAYVFSGGPGPVPLAAGDANGDGEVNVADGVFLINYVFNQGPSPECP